MTLQRPEAYSAEVAAARRMERVEEEIRRLKISRSGSLDWFSLMPYLFGGWRDYYSQSPAPYEEVESTRKWNSPGFYVLNDREVILTGQIQWDFPDVVLGMIADESHDWSELVAYDPAFADALDHYRWTYGGFAGEHIIGCPAAASYATGPDYGDVPGFGDGNVFPFHWGQLFPEELCPNAQAISLKIPYNGYNNYFETVGWFEAELWMATGPVNKGGYLYANYFPQPWIATESLYYADAHWTGDGIGPPTLKERQVYGWKNSHLIPPRMVLDLDGVGWVIDNEDEAQIPHEDIPLVSSGETGEF